VRLVHGLERWPGRRSRFTSSRKPAASTFLPLLVPPSDRPGSASSSAEPNDTEETGAHLQSVPCGSVPGRLSRRLHSRERLRPRPSNPPACSTASTGRKRAFGQVDQQHAAGTHPGRFVNRRHHDGLPGPTPLGLEGKLGHECIEGPRRTARKRHHLTGPRPSPSEHGRGDLRVLAQRVLEGELTRCGGHGHRGSGQDPRRSARPPQPPRAEGGSDPCARTVEQPEPSAIRRSTTALTLAGKNLERGVADATALVL